MSADENSCCRCGSSQEVRTTYRLDLSLTLCPPCLYGFILIESAPERAPIENRLDKPFHTE